MINLVPRDSLIWPLVRMGKFMETPWSFLIALGLSGLSHLLKRNVWIDLQETGKVWPNLSVIVIGKAGIGKDTAINFVQRNVLGLDGDRQVKGATKEALAHNFYLIHDRLAETPTCGYVLAREMKAMFGNKDYEQGMAEFITDILSDLEEYTSATKTKPFKIPQPTLVMMAGSTRDWFQKLPPDMLAGGFIPRFLVVVEDEARQSIALPKQMQDWEDKQEIEQAKRGLWKQVEGVEEFFSLPREMFMTVEAMEMYANWYDNRYRLFSPLMQDYAHRSRGHVVKLAMLMACSRLQPMISLVDVQFALTFFEAVVTKMEEAIIPGGEEARAVNAIRQLLPCEYGQLIIKLRPKFSSRVVGGAVEMLVKTGEVCYNGRTLCEKKENA